MIRGRLPITLEAALKEVTEERFCKGHHYKDVALTDEMVAQIVQVKSLVNMGFINTAITDEALQYLATLSKLKLLFLEDNKQVTGEGFKYFASKPIDHISLDGCPITDENLKIVLQVPRLKSLSLRRTRVTFEGLMAVAHYNKVNFYLDKSFTQEQIKAFEQAQRTAGKKKPAAPPSHDLSIVKQLLLDFFAAMTQWEAFATKNDDTKEGDFLVREKCKALFQKYCTNKRRAGYRPEGIYFSLNEGGTYRAHQIIDSELVTKNKIYLYTQNDRDDQFRFLIIRKDGEWRIDECQRHDGGWTKYGL